MLSRSNERNDAKSISVPEPVQVVDPTTVMPFVDVQGYLLHGEAGMGRETIALSSWNGDHSSGPVPSVQETEQTDQRNPISTEYAFLLHSFGVFGCSLLLVSLLRQNGYVCFFCTGEARIHVSLDSVFPNFSVSNQNLYDLRQEKRKGSVIQLSKKKERTPSPLNVADNLLSL